MAKAAKVRSPQGAKLLKCRSRESDDLFLGGLLGRSSFRGWSKAAKVAPSGGGSKAAKVRLYRMIDSNSTNT